MSEKLGPIGVITNVTSGRNKKGKFLKRSLKKIFADRALIIQTKKIEHIAPALKKFRQKGISILCIDGGDGTLQKVCTEWIHQTSENEELPYIIPIRGGTTNATALDFGIKGNQEEIGRRICALYDDVLHNRIDELPWKTKHLLKVQSSLTPRNQYGFILATGVVYKGVKKYQDRGEPSLRSAFTTIAEIVTNALLQNTDEEGFFTMMQGKLIIDGIVFGEEHFTGMMATTLNRLNFKITPFYADNDSKAGFNFAALALPAMEAVKHAFDLFRGRRSPHLPPDKYFNDKVRHVVLESDSGFMLDGELFDAQETNHLEINLGPRIRIIQLGDTAISQHLHHWKFRAKSKKKIDKVEGKLGPGSGVLT